MNLPSGYQKVFFSEKRPSVPYRGATTVPYRGGFRGPYNGNPLYFILSQLPDAC